jgi:hypothetical protein
MTTDEIMALADKYARAWHANQSSRVVAAYDDGRDRKALRAAIEALQADVQKLVPVVSAALDSVAHIRSLDLPGDSHMWANAEMLVQQAQRAIAAMALDKS